MIVSPERLKPLVREAARQELERRKARRHPAYLLDHVKCIDNTTGETFDFQLIRKGDPWHWQRALLDEWIKSPAHINLKARQIGVTWLAAGYALWTLLNVPGSKVLVVSINLGEAVKVINRIWDMYLSLPPHLREVEVIKPSQAKRPAQEIQLQHPDGRISGVIGLPSTPSAGHGETAALVILDEFARQEYARETWKAVLPTTQKPGGRAVIISTGNGVSTGDVGGNFFHHLWENADTYGISKRFLPWDLHPDRDEAWYANNAGKLSLADRGEQYPRDEDEAFILTGRPFFDVEALKWYRERVRQPIERFDFVEEGVAARRKQSPAGQIRVYEFPRKDRSYAIGADVATGRGQDFSAAYVIDLYEMKIVAEFHGKIDPDLFATQLHYLGKFYGASSGCGVDAWLAVETGGGYGESVIIPLRDGRSGRPPYTRLYKHVLSSRPDMPISKPFGFPMNQKTRRLVISQLEAAIRERLLPFLTERVVKECFTFVEADTSPSPRAADGANDDAIFGLAIGLEMYRLRGHHPKLMARREKRRGTKQDYETLYPFQSPDKEKVQAAMDSRYAPEGTAA